MRLSRAFGLFAMLGGCGQSVGPADGSGADHPVDRDADAAGALDASADVPAYAPCMRTLLQNDESCVCIGYDEAMHQPRRPGLCATFDPDHEPLAPPSACLFALEPALCITTSQDAQVCYGCVPSNYCMAIEQGGLTQTHDYHAYCLWSDGTLVVTGALPAANCPSGSTGILCGSGCADCFGGAGCWGSSEQNPLGACVHNQLDADFPTQCLTSQSCAADKACLHLTNTTADGGVAPGLCVARDRCQQAAALASMRFQCGP